MAKLIVIGLAIKAFPMSFPHVFAPFVGVLEIFPEPWFRRACIIVFTVSGAALLFNRAVRFNCIVLGSVILVALMASKGFYKNSQVFTAFILIFAGLQEKGRPPHLIWWQLSVLYLGASLNKFLEPDWRSGQFFEVFLGAQHESDLYLALAPYFPPLVLAAAMSWMVILAEAVAGVCFLFRRGHSWAVWLAMGVHFGAAVFVGTDYGIFLLVLLASYVSVLRWPDQIEVRESGAKYLRIMKHFWPEKDASSFLRWRTDDDETPLTLTYDCKTYSERAAFMRLMLWCPATYMLLILAIAAPYGEWHESAVRIWGCVGILILSGVAGSWIFGKVQRRSI